jgi:hypothetical protein
MKGVDMGSNSDNFFAPAPSREEFARYLKESTELKLTLKMESKSDLVRYAETIRMCTNAGMTLRAISIALKDLHGVDFGHTAVHRFIRRFPALRRRAEAIND